MCEVVQIGDCGVAIICGDPIDHVCNEDAMVYGLRNGERKFFTDSGEERLYYENNYKEILSGSVACSLCGRAAIDDAMRL